MHRMTRRHQIQVQEASHVVFCFARLLALCLCIPLLLETEREHENGTAMEEKPRHAALFLPERRRPLIASATPSRGARLRAVAGETAAECAAILCCCPCCLASLVVVAAVKLPSAIAQRAWWRRRREVYLKEKRTKANGNKVGANHDDENNSRGGFILAADTAESLPAKTTSEELVELEQVMIAKFYGAGFWRSPSQRGEVKKSSKKTNFASP